MDIERTKMKQANQKDARNYLSYMTNEELFANAQIAETAYSKISDYYDYLQRDAIYLYGIDLYGDLTERVSDIHCEMFTVKNMYEKAIKNRELWNEYLAYCKDAKKKKWR